MAARKFFAPEQLRVFEARVQKLELAALPASHRQGPDYLNVLRIWDLPQLVSLLGDRVVPWPGAEPTTH